MKKMAKISRKMVLAEVDYKIHNKEMLSITASFKEWRHYLEGAALPTKIFTDHCSLEYFTTSKQLDCRQARWSEILFGLLTSFVPQAYKILNWTLLPDDQMYTPQQ